MAEPRVAIVVPWRAGDPDRERAWSWARGWWEQFGWPIHEVEHGPPEPFSRSWCINEGARRAWPWDVLVAIDADVFASDPSQIQMGVQRAWETGRLTIPHTSGHDLSAGGTQRILSGVQNWESLVTKRRPVCTSRVWIMRADLFGEVGGFDERFEGWGHEDVAAFHAMRTLRGCDQLDGICYHLWHRPSFPRAKGTHEWREGRELAQRYLDADRQGWPAIAPILAERTETQMWTMPETEDPIAPSTYAASNPTHAVDVVCLTAGRKLYMTETIASFTEKVHGPIVHRTIIDDSGDLAYGRWLKETYPEWEIVTTRGKLGFTRAIQAAWKHENGRTGGSPYVFHLEEDFTFDRDVELTDMIAVLEHDAEAAQVALLRGAFFPPEIEAGGIIQEDPDAYTQHLTPEGIPFLVHEKFFTTNPCLYRRRLIRQGWPSARNSETYFTRLQRRKGAHFAFLGSGEPWCSHIGYERTNLGY